MYRRLVHDDFMHITLWVVLEWCT